MTYLKRIQIADETNEDYTIEVNANGEIKVDTISGSITLPTGAATESTLSSIDSKDFSTETTLSGFKSQNNTDLTNIKTSVDSTNTKLSDKTQFTKLTDGTNDGTFTADGKLKVEASVAAGAGNQIQVEDESGTSQNVSRATGSAQTIPISIRDTKYPDDNEARVEWNDRLATQNPDPYHISTRFYGEYLDKEAWAVIDIGNGTVTPSTDYIELKDVTTTTDRAVLASRTFKEPSVGQLSHLVILAAYDQTTATNIQRAWGLITRDEGNGYLFELINGSLYATIISGGVYTRTDISSYINTSEGYDRFDIYHTGFRVRFIINGTQVHSTSSLGGQGLLENMSLTPFWAITPAGGVPSANVYLRANMAAYGDPTFNKSFISDLHGHIADVSDRGYLKTEDYGTIIFNEGFLNDTLDTSNRWSETIVGSASKTVSDNELQLLTTTGATDSICEISIPSINSLSSDNSIRFVGSAKFDVTNKDANNYQEFGLIEDTSKNNGAFFRYNNGTLYAVVIKGGVETTQALDINVLDKYYLLKIKMEGAISIKFIINDAFYWAEYSDDEHIINSKTMKAYVYNYNSGAISNATEFEIENISLIESSKQSIKLLGVDDNEISRNVAVSTTGRLKVSQEPPTPPVDTTSVQQTAQGDQGSNQTAYLNYTIPNGETLIIQRFIGGAEGGGGQSKISLYYDSTGTGTGDLIAVGYVADNNFQFDLNAQYIGDGTARIRLARTRLDAGTRETFGRWEGYY